MLLVSEVSLECRAQAADGLTFGFSFSCGPYSQLILLPAFSLTLFTVRGVRYSSKLPIYTILRTYMKNV